MCVAGGGGGGGGGLGGAMVLGKLPAPGRPAVWKTVGQGPIVLAVGAGRGCLDIFTLVYPFLFLPLSKRRPDLVCPFLFLPLSKRRLDID